jgi:hyperosmotically inducible protein
MRLPMSRYLLAPVLTLSLFSLANFAQADSAADILSARQESQIWTTYALSPYLRANDLTVSVQEGKATLSGIVSEDVNKDLAKQIAMGVKGIKSVDNNIEVRHDAQPKQPLDNYWQGVEDASITAAVKSKLLWSKSTDGRDIEVETHNGRVKLTGQTTNKMSHDNAGRLAIGTRGVTSVNNQLKIDKVEPSTTDMAKKEAKEVKQDISDSWITTKVVSTYLYSTNVSGSDINVSTQAGVVTLKGKVDSGAERALAIELADNVRGVKSVNAQQLTF